MMRKNRERNRRDIDQQTDGQGGADADVLDEAAWSEYYTKIQRAAETFLTD